jgi:predicted lipid-binding transport protein (Tim44 family)
MVHARVAENFAVILRAWSNRDADAMEPHVSRDYLERAREAVDLFDRNFQVNGIEGAKLRDVALRLPDGSAQSDRVEAYIAFVARDWIEDLRTGDVLAGDPELPRAFTKCWTFVFEGRRRWVIDRIESVWDGPAEDMAGEQWPGLPTGWYSPRDRPATPRYWDGSGWGARRPEGVTAGQ